jgi:hypothetical protein
VNVDRFIIAAAIALCACGKGKENSAASNAGDSETAMDEMPTRSSQARRSETATPQLRQFQHGGDEGAALSAIKSLPAWSAVIERYRLLDRRLQRGSVHGFLLEHEGQLRLVDETTGQGALSIPVAVPDGLVLPLPLRALVWGAWHWEGDDKEWLWRGTSVESLAAGPPPEFAPGLSPRFRDPPAELAKASTVSRRGGPIVFHVLEASPRAGDGWLISDEIRGPAVARLLLPGEKEPYGDQNTLHESERWQLNDKDLYWVEISRFRPSRGDSLPIYTARSVPYRRPN